MCQHNFLTKSAPTTNDDYFDMFDSTYPCFLLEEEASSCWKFVIIWLPTFTDTQKQSYDRLIFLPLWVIFFPFCWEKKAPTFFIKIPTKSMVKTKVHCYILVLARVLLTKLWLKIFDMRVRSNCKVLEKFFFLAPTDYNMFFTLWKKLFEVIWTLKWFTATYKTFI